MKNIEIHNKAMHSIVNGLQNLPLTLKGGTALLFCYGLDRHSEDLDFDSPVKLNLKSKITQALKNSGISVTNFKTVKDTATTLRYKLLYDSNGFIGSLKIEVKNNNMQAINTIKVNGISTYSIKDLFDMKMKAANLETGRAKIRDLYDLGHILKNYHDNLSDNQIEQAKDFNAAIKKDASLFVISHQKDKILKSISLEKIIDNINKALSKATNTGRSI